MYNDIAQAVSDALAKALASEISKLYPTPPLPSKVYNNRSLAEVYAEEIIDHAQAIVYDLSMDIETSHEQSEQQELNKYRDREDPDYEGY
jgi:hypothetical protein